MEGVLSLYSTHSGLRSWRLNYKFKGRFYTLTFGQYHLISFKTAREKLIEANGSENEGINPTGRKKALQGAERAPEENAFEVVTNWCRHFKLPGCSSRRLCVQFDARRPGWKNPCGTK
ncbi:MAG: Arm DNA-binding domain-containing protein [Deltaproteobacteria bacterium]|nr:Arm DNA-binding domain-containing protein [Deltaproteobacteria bacterium]